MMEPLKEAMATLLRTRTCIPGRVPRGDNYEVRTRDPGICRRLSGVGALLMVAES